MATNIIYPTLERAVEVHESIITKSDGLDGIKDKVTYPPTISSAVLWP